MSLHHKVPDLSALPGRGLSRMSEGAAEGLILCGDMEGVAQYSQSHISKLNSRWTALGKVLWVRCGWWQTGSQWDSWHAHQRVWLHHGRGPDEVGHGWDSLTVGCLRH